MTVDTVKLKERRRHLRVGLVLSGRYMLAGGGEFPCETIDVSANGVALKGMKVGRYGERVVAYIEDLGRIEGFIVRRAIGRFALDIRSSPQKHGRLSDRISWLAKRGAVGLEERRERARMDVWHEKTLLISSDGREFLADLVDVSLDGAAVLVDVALPAGARITLGEQTAYVLRAFPGGLAVTFEPLDEAARSDDFAALTDQP